ncbi:AAA family ATPase [Pseudarthrobacter psychrotolerans]|uniref:AAA family ATPase n=1 Tax=Pseudarthrobacter psychrotolerans TaxID=2697569 RepID=A0A6P1NK35_9MICC|nr:AAA family ATPase [Pseudarthrobacter psychrotolerans]QHK18820.1 AAA family ATPase [Pseudarthrobacter psychrotolerans]
MTYVDATAPDPLDGVFAADWLTKQILPAVEYVVPGVIPEGLTLLVAPPKIGKSWMVLGLGVAAATGDCAFGSIPVDRRPVLYLALEDGARRLQSRLRTIGVTTGPRGLFFMTDVPAGPIPTIATFLERNAEHKPLVILDTLGKVRGTYGGNDAYGNDYSQMSALKDLVDRHPGSSLIVVHHTNKGEKSDFLDSVSGTQGLAGAADSILLIQRDRQTESSTLHVTSRDAKEGQYSLNLTDGIWKLDGSSLREAAEAMRNRAATEGVGDDMAEIVTLVNKYPEGMKPKDVATLLHWEDGKVRLYLRRAYESGRIANPKRGLYTPVTTETSVTIPLEGPGESISSYGSYTAIREAS